MFNVTTCFIESSHAVKCAVGTVCSHACDSAFYGGEVFMWGYVRDMMSAFVDSWNYVCLGSPIDAIADATSPKGVCDVYVGSMHENLESGREVLRYGVPYGAAGISALVGKGDPSPVYQSWSWLFPFNTWLWIAVLITIFVVPVFSAIIERDPGETWLDSYGYFLADSWHAVTGVDTMKRTLEVNGMSSALSVAVAIFAKIVTAIYACNLASFVLYMTYNPRPFDGSYFAYTRNYLAPYVADPKEIVLGEFNSSVIDQVSANKAVIVSDSMEVSYLRTFDTMVVPEYANVSVLVSPAFPISRYDRRLATLIDSFVTPASKSYYPWRWWSWYSNGVSPARPVSIGLSSIWGLFVTYFAASLLVVITSHVVPKLVPLFSCLITRISSSRRCESASCPGTPSSRATT